MKIKQNLSTNGVAIPAEDWGKIKEYDKLDEYLNLAWEQKKF